MKHYDDWAIALDIDNGNYLYAGWGPDNVLVPRPDTTERAAKFTTALLAIQTLEKMILEHDQARNGGRSIWTAAVIKKVHCDCKAKLEASTVNYSIHSKYSNGLNIHICRKCVQSKMADMEC